MTQETYFTISLGKLRRKTGEKTGKEIRGKKVEIEGNSSHNSMRITAESRFLY